MKSMTSSIFVANVPDFYTEPLILDLFSAFGFVSKVILIPALLPITHRPTAP